MTYYHDKICVEILNICENLTFLFFTRWGENMWLCFRIKTETVKMIPLIIRMIRLAMAIVINVPVLVIDMVIMLISKCWIKS